MWYVETLSHHRRELISNIEIISVIVRIPGLDYFLVLLWCHHMIFSYLVFVRDSLRALFICSCCLLNLVM